MLKRKGVLLALGTAIISGVSIFINKFGVSGTNPFMFTFLKNILVGIFLIATFMLFKNFSEFKRLKKQEWGKLVLIGLVGGSAPFLLFFYGLSISSAVTAAFIHKTLFIWVAILALIFLKEKINKTYLIGAGLLMIANVLLISLKSFSFGVGELLILIATLLWSVEIAISKHALKNLSSNIVAFGRMFFGSIFILGFLFLTNNFSIPSSFANIGWILLTSAFLFGYVFTFYSALKLEKATVVTPILLLGSFITLTLNFIYAGTLELPKIIGFILMFSGLYLILRKNSSITLDHRQRF